MKSYSYTGMGCFEIYLGCKSNRAIFTALYHNCNGEIDKHSTSRRSGDTLVFWIKLSTSMMK